MLNNKPRFVSPLWPTRRVHSTDMHMLLGVPGSKYPAEGMPPRKVQGVTVWVKPLHPQPVGWRKRSTHRVMCSCPVCGQEMSAGRLHQHKCVKAGNKVWKRWV